jgi:peptidoglycan/LPS O-acetylase OafA/YrhL
VGGPWIVSTISFLLILLFMPNHYNFIFNTNLGLSYFEKEFLLFGFLSSLLILGTINSNSPIKFIMESKPFIFIGKISFSAYLCHIIILEVIIKINFFNQSIKFFIFFVLTFIVSYILFHYIEMPLSKIRLR